MCMPSYLPTLTQTSFLGATLWLGLTHNIIRISAIQWWSTYLLHRAYMYMLEWSTYAEAHVIHVEWGDTMCWSTCAEAHAGCIGSERIIVMLWITWEWWDNGMFHGEWWDIYIYIYIYICGVMGARVWLDKWRNIYIYICIYT
jgi:hypothetical protein